MILNIGGVTMSLKKILAMSAALILFGASSVANGQSFSVSDQTATVGSASVAVSWSWTAGSDVTAFGVDIVFDNTFLTPQTTTSGGFETVDGCLANVPAGVSLKSCNLINASTIRVSLQNLGTPAASIASLAPGGTITFDIASTAVVGDSSNFALTLASVVPGGTSVTLDNGAENEVEIVAAPAPILSVAPTTQAFAAANGSTDTKTFTVTNTGNADGLTVAAALSGADDDNFSIVSGGNTCPTAAPGLAQAATCTIQVQFAPDAVDTFSASLDLTGNGGTANVALTGTGSAGPAGAITITPAGTFDFGELLTGIEEETQVFTATNTGAAGSVVTISSAALNLLFGSPLSIVANTCTNGTELEKGESCLVTVKEAPIATGTAERTLTVTGADANSTALSDSVKIKGEGIEEARPTSNPAAGTSAASQSEIVGPEGSNDFTVVWGNAGNVSYDLSCALSGSDTSNVWSLADATATVAADGSHTVTTTCALPDTETYTETLTCTVTKPDQETLTYTHNYECVGLPPLPVPVDNKWALALLALMMLMAASFGFRFIARQ